MESLEIQRKQEINELKKELEESGLNGNANHFSHHEYNQFNHANHFYQHPANNLDHNYGATFTDSKINYIRSMFLQYLCCKDPLVKPHIESALIAIFRYTDEERAVIEEGHKLESQDAITALTTYFGTSLISNFS